MRAFELTEEKKLKLNTPEFKALLTPGLLKLADAFKKEGHEIRIAGGAVRDLILGKRPKDIDIATTAKPDEMIKIGEKYNIKTIPTGLQHGTVTFHINGEDYEVTTLRIDVETYGRQAKVEFTRNWKQDAARRDLTFNAMSLDLDGTLYDYFGGIEDLKKGQAHFVGDADERIKEDYLRILRYFRFKGRLAQPEFDQNTLDAIERNAKGLEQISGERIWMEISKILAGKHTKLLLDKIRDTGVDLYINLPPLNIDVLNRIKAHTDNPVTILGGMLQKESQVDKLAQEWKLSTPERELMHFIVKHKHKKFDLNTAKDMWTNKKTPNDFVLELAKYFGRDDIVRTLQTWETPQFPISGNDLIQLGYKPGPEMGKILKQLERKWKESDYKLPKEDLLGMIGIQESVNTEEYLPLAKAISDLARYLEPGKTTGTIVKYIRENYGKEVARMFHMLVYVAQNSDYDVASVNKMIHIPRWNDVKNELADNIHKIKLEINKILMDPTRRKATQLGLKVVK